MTPIEEHELEAVSGGIQQDLIDLLERFLRGSENVMYREPITSEF